MYPEPVCKLYHPSCRISTKSYLISSFFCEPRPVCNEVRGKRLMNDWLLKKEKGSEAVMQRGKADRLMRMYITGDTLQQEKNYCLHYTFYRAHQ